MEISSQLPVGAVVSPGKEPAAPSEQQAGLTPNPVLTLWRREKYLASGGNRTTIPRSPTRSLVAIQTMLFRLLFYLTTI